MMSSKREVLEWLALVEEPVVQQRLIQLQWIQNIVIDDRRVSLTVITLNNDEYSREKLDRQIKPILHRHGMDQVHIRYRSPTEYEKKKIEHESVPPVAETEDALRKGHAVGLEDTPLLSQSSKTHFIAVSSGKGGVGKSTVTVNLAVALARQGYEVGIIDADIYGFSVPRMMGIVQEAVVHEGKVCPLERFGVKVMSTGFFVEEHNPVIWRGPMLGNMLRQFIVDVSWGKIDYMLFDLPPGTGDIALDIHQIIPQAYHLIVTTPHDIASTVAVRAGNMAQKVGHDLLGIIENMAYIQNDEAEEKTYLFGRDGGETLAKRLDTELLSKIPFIMNDQHSLQFEPGCSVHQEHSQLGQIYNHVASIISRKCNIKNVMLQ